MDSRRHPPPHRNSVTSKIEKRYTDTWLVAPLVRDRHAKRRMSCISGQSEFSTGTHHDASLRRVHSLDTLPLLVPAYSTHTPPVLPPVPRPFSAHTVTGAATVTDIVAATPTKTVGETPTETAGDTAAATHTKTVENTVATTPTTATFHRVSMTPSFQHLFNRPFFDPSTSLYTQEKESVTDKGYGISIRTPEETQRHSMPLVNIPIPNPTTFHVRIERDYSKGNGITQFETLVPAALVEAVSREYILHTVTTINSMLSYAETLSWRDVFDNVMECLTIYTWPILFPSKYQKALEHLTEFIETQNQEVYQPLGICITPPVRVAFLYLEFKVFKQNRL